MLILVTDRKEFAKTLSPKLLAKDIYHLCVPSAFATFTCEREDTGAVILDCVPSPRLGEHICAALKRSYPDLPVALIAAPEVSINAPADAILREGDMEELLASVLSLCYANGWGTAPLSTYYLGMDPSEGVYYMGAPLALSPTERRVLHCIFYRAPRPTDCEHLLALCANEAPANADALAVLIHRINQKAGMIDPRPLIINEYGKGYRLRDGIID